MGEKMLSETSSYWPLVMPLENKRKEKPYPLSYHVQDNAPQLMSDVWVLEFTYLIQPTL